MKEKILGLLGRLEVVEELLGRPEILLDQAQYRILSQEHARLQDIKEAWEEYARAEEDLCTNRKLLREEKDPELSALVQEEIALLEPRLEAAQFALESLLVPPDPRDDRPIILELEQEREGKRRRSLSGTAFGCICFLPIRWGGPTSCSLPILPIWAALKSM